MLLFPGKTLMSKKYWFDLKEVLKGEAKNKEERDIIGIPRKIIQGVWIYKGFRTTVYFLLGLYRVFYIGFFYL